MKFDFIDTAGSIFATLEVAPLRQVGGVDVFGDIAIYCDRYFLLTPGGYGPDTYVETVNVSYPETVLA